MTRLRRPPEEPSRRRSVVSIAGLLGTRRRGTESLPEGGRYCTVWHLDQGQKHRTSLNTNRVQGRMYHRARRWNRFPPSPMRSPGHEPSSTRAGCAGRRSGVRPSREHGHLRCEACGNTWEIEADEARRLTTTLVRDRRFHVNLSHLSIVGRCSECSPG